MTIPFNKPYLTQKGIEYITEAFNRGHVSGDGEFTQRCQRTLEAYTGAHKALLTHSCTAALEMCAILADIQPGDEVIMPSYTFVSTANAFVLRGATPVFVDIRPDTLNIDETLIEPAITERTKAIVVVHYAGVGCEMDRISAIAEHHKLMLIEDAAQALGAEYKGRKLGSFGQLATLSFHETKNLISGEGGALLINDPALVERAEIIREKGTNRSKFFRGMVDKYTWVDIGSSYLPSDIIAAFLFAQLEAIDSIIARRKTLWDQYDQALRPLEKTGWLHCPEKNNRQGHNAHIYYLIFNEPAHRDQLIGALKAQGIIAVFHYIPLHSAPAGQAYGKTVGPMAVTNQVSNQLVRLPLYHELSTEEQQRVIDCVTQTVASLSL